MTSAQPSRRVWQFSIRSILLLTLLVAAFFAGKVSSDKKLATALKAAEEAREREAERAKAESERARRAEVMAGLLRRRAQQQAQSQLYSLRTRLSAEQYLKQEAQMALRHASRERSVAEKKLEKLTALGNDLIETPPGKMAWLDLLKAISACAPSEKGLEITSISFEHHDDLASWFDKLPERSKTRHMLQEDASRPPAGAGRIVTIITSCPQPTPLSTFLTNLRERAVELPEVPPKKVRKRRRFTHVTVVPNAAGAAAATYTVEFVWKK